MSIEANWKIFLEWLYMKYDRSFHMKFEYSSPYFHVQTSQVG